MQKQPSTLKWVLPIILVFSLTWSLWSYLFQYRTFTILSPITISVQRGATPLQVSQKLEEMGVIPNSHLFYLQGKFFNQWTKLKSGDYLFYGKKTTAEVFNLLTSGVSIGVPILIREGDNLYDIAQNLSQHNFGSREKWVQLFKSPQNFLSMLSQGNLDNGWIDFKTLNISLEGFLFPETYQFSKQSEYKEILNKLLQTFFSKIPNGFTEKMRANGLSFYQGIILASMVEKETGAPEERPRIAGVFYNRLRKKMRLQSDPTTIYGIWEHYKGNITRTHLLTPSPYNTYTIPGLPAGPICNPGAEALMAVMAPEEHDDFYFVSRNDGTHVFSKTYQEHESAVKDFQINPDAREGKSWRDLKRRNIPKS